MTLPKLLAIVSILLFGAIGIAAIFKTKPTQPETGAVVQVPLEVELDQEIQAVVPALATPSPVAVSSVSPIVASSIDLPDANRIEELFNRNDPKLPIVETITYKSHVPWQKGRPAWLSDYASHYNTSRHFIARSLNGKPDYLKQDLAEGDRFNVFKKDKNFQFYLVVDTSRCKMWFYYIDLDDKQATLLKTYQVGLGRLDSTKASGLLTPLGKYSLGDRIAVYKPKVMGMHQGKKIEVITVFGTRWIPFEKELGPCTAPAKGFGIHGTPWHDKGQGILADDTSSIGKYESDGCIRLATPDIEELFAIIITKPTTIEIVPDFSESTLAGAGAGL
ncbi:L,D-transpeptidase [Candidatus Protochlamydia phocaeensis]|uniref:L,D-transpeptidase n=1 Tax=Candidatus Protochlamydia phocaeensis TaxID=1414722 RepID=UPI0008386E3C|nr:L,D-transpeptidase [Candidatus Protochlamydia phocaeensis]